tara:strand:- start:476 stop:1003 length:528 start_codon:yes stop_codon:yes gene_type:complete
VSNFGEVFSTKRDKVRQLKGCANKEGYLNVGLCDNNKPITHTIHALVGNAFIGLRTGGLSFDHIDRDKLNNRADNIQLATKTEQNINRDIGKNNKSGEKNIGNRFDKSNGNEFYILQIERNKKPLIRREFKKTDYNLEDVVKFRDDTIAKYDHTVLLNKVHIEMIKRIRSYTCRR